MKQSILCSLLLVSAVATAWNQSWGQENPFPGLGQAAIDADAPPVFQDAPRPQSPAQSPAQMQSPAQAPMQSHSNMQGPTETEVLPNMYPLNRPHLESMPPGYTQRYEAPLGLQAASWTYIPPPPTRTVKLHDIVSIRVDEIARLQADGTSSSRKNSLYDAILKDWVKIRDGRLEPNLQAAGDPRVQGTMNSLYRATSQLQSRESMSFNIAAQVVDIRPNGNLVLEAHKTIYNNENVWETSLSGTCRSQDLGSDNVVLSRDLLDLQIRKNDRGRMRDGYKRGWLTRWVETFAPF